MKSKKKRFLFVWSLCGLVMVCATARAQVTEPSFNFEQVPSGKVLASAMKTAKRYLDAAENDQELKDLEAEAAQARLEYQSDESNEKFARKYFGSQTDFIKAAVDASNTAIAKESAVDRAYRRYFDEASKRVQEAKAAWGDAQQGRRNIRMEQDEVENEIQSLADYSDSLVGALKPEDDAKLRTILDHAEFLTKRLKQSATTATAQEQLVLNLQQAKVDAVRAMAYLKKRFLNERYKTQILREKARGLLIEIQVNQAKEESKSFREINGNEPSLKQLNRASIDAFRNNSN